MPIRSTLGLRPSGTTLELEMPGIEHVEGRWRSAYGESRSKVRSSSTARCRPDGCMTTFEEFVRDVTGDETLSLDARRRTGVRREAMHRVSIVSRASVRDVGRRARRRGAGPAALPDADRGRRLRRLRGGRVAGTDGCRFGEAIVRMRRAHAPLCHDDARPRHGRAERSGAGRARRDTARSAEDLLLGVYADVEQPGVIRVGDPVEVLD